MSSSKYFRQVVRPTLAVAFGLCLPFAMAAKPVPETVRPIKWHPGHYMLTPSVDHYKASSIRELRTEPTIAGVQHRVSWRLLEPEKGRYDFTRIEELLALCQGIGKRLVIQVLDRSFAAAGDRNLPAYLEEDPAYGGGLFIKPNGSAIARIWEPSVMDREVALFAALAARFDREPYFEGIAISEVSPGFRPKQGPPGYDKLQHAAQLKRLLAAARRSWTRTNVFIFTNSLANQAGGIIEYAYRHRCGIGGPDVLPPPHRGIQGDRIIRGIEPGFTFDYRGKTAIGYAVQEPELCGKEGCHSPQALYDHAVNTLRATHIFWIRFGTRRDTLTEKYSWQDGILPVIRANQGRINTACPTAFAGRCLTDPD